MKDKKRTKNQLIAELAELRRRIAELEASERQRKRADEALQKSQGRLKVIFDEAVDAIFTKDIQGKYVAVNKACREIFGLPKKEIIGKTDFDLFSRESARHIREIDNRVYQGEIVREENTKPLGGRTYTFHVTKVPLYDDRGEILGLCGIARDVTQRKRAEEELRQSEEEFRLAFENAKDAIFWADPKTGLLTKCNKAAEILLEKKREEIIGYNQTTLHPPEKATYYAKMFKRHMKERRAVDEEAEIITKSKKIKPVHITASLSKVGGKPIIQGIFRDITERTRAEKKLKASNKRFEDIAANAFEWIWEVNANGKYTYASPIVEKILGYKPEEVLKKHFYDLFHPEDREELKKAAFEAFAKKQPFRKFINRNIHKNGKTIWLSTSGVPVLDEKGDLTGYRGADTDITERRQAEESLREERNKAQRYLDVAGVMFLVIDANQKVSLVNKKGCEILGYKEDEIVGKNWFANFIPKRMRREVGAIFKKLMDGEIDPIKSFENPVLTKSGEEKLIAWHNIVLTDENGEGYATLSSGEDVTDRKRAEAIQRIQYQIANAVHTTEDLSELFRAIQQDLSTFLDTKNFFIALYDRESDTLSLPYFKDEKDHFETFPARKTLTAYVIKHDKPLLATSDEFEKLVRSGEVEKVGTDSKIWLGVPLKAKDEIVGALVVQSYTDENAYDQKDLELLKFVSSQIGLSIERKKSEETLRGSEERYRIITDQTGQLVYDYDVKTDNIEWSGAIEEVTGYSPKEFQRVDIASWKEKIHPEDRERTVAFSHETSKKSGRYSFEYRFETKNGSYRNILDEGLSLPDEKGTVVRKLGVMKDITERKLAEKALRESEEQLRQSQKMEAVGRLAGGVAHDLNNLLTGVTGYTDLLSTKIEDDGSPRKYLTEIQKATNRATSLIRQLLAFSRKQMLQPKILNLNDVVTDTGEILRRVIGEDIELITNLDPRLGHVRADPGQMEQVIMNLAVNARDAMPQGGKLIIETANAKLDKEYAHRHVAVQPGPYVMLAMSDTGDGMDEETRSHIFEPFFTTKEVGKGTGLGLSTVYGIVKQSDGHIWVYSEPGEGTTFKVYLPRLNKNGKSTKPSFSPNNLQQGSETVLVVEDEQIVRELVQEILQKCGYTVLVARDGAEALSVCKKHKGPIHLMVTDVVMPQMNGLQLAERLAPLRPETKVLYISGYTDNTLVNHGELKTGLMLLQKPFTSDDLARKVRQVMDAPNTIKAAVPL